MIVGCYQAGKLKYVGKVRNCAAMTAVVFARLDAPFAGKYRRFASATIRIFAVLFEHIRRIEKGMEKKK
jgi:hypothetical protein